MHFFNVLEKQGCRDEFLKILPLPRRCRCRVAMDISGAVQVNVDIFNYLCMLPL
jgi:hypothetical protein